MGAAGEGEASEAEVERMEGGGGERGTGRVVVLGLVADDGAGMLLVGVFPTGVVERRGGANAEQREGGVA